MAFRRSKRLTAVDELALQIETFLAGHDVVAATNVGAPGQTAGYFCILRRGLRRRGVEVYYIRGRANGLPRTEGWFLKTFEPLFESEFGERRVELCVYQGGVYCGLFMSVK